VASIPTSVTQLSQPLAEVREATERRFERPRLQHPPATIIARDAHRRDHVVAMHIQARAPLDHYIHLSPPSETLVINDRPEGAYRE
jgi:hypothetical protein